MVGQSLFQRSAVGQFGDCRLGVRPENFARLVGVADDTDRVVAEPLELVDNRAPGIASGADDSNHRVSSLRGWLSAQH